MLYPAEPGAQFDFDYYLSAHMPLSQRLLKDHGFTGFEVQRCMSDVRGNAPAYVCITHLDFDSLEQFQAGMAAHGEALRADFVRYTNVTPVATVCKMAGP